MDRRRFFTFSLLGLVGGVAQAQGLKLPKPPKIPGLKLPEINGEQFIKRTPPLTTNLADVFEAVPGFDDWEPKDAAPLTLIPRDENGDYLVLPGLFEVVAQSFCLKAGSNPPGRNKGVYGSGYLYAPLKGPKAAIIDRILRRSEDFPDLPQYQVQVLLWAIIAESDLSKCPPNIQKTAKLLLDAKQCQALENDVLAVVPTQLRGKVYGSLPPLVKDALEAENRIRERLASAFADASGNAEALVDSVNNPGEKVSALYNDMEAIAMRVGDLPDAPEAEKVPWGRWSWHPDGFFLRLLPSGYSQTTRQLYYPEVFTFEGNKIIAPDGTVHTVSGTVSNDAQALQKLFADTPNTPANFAQRSILARAALSALARSKYKVAIADYQRSVCGRFGSGFGGGGGGGAGMGRPGSQRLGQSRKPKDKSSIEKARKATDALQEFGGQFTEGLDLPFFMVDKLLNWQYDMAGAIDRAMNGEDGGHVNCPGCSLELAPISDTFCNQGDEGLGIVPLPRPKRVPDSKKSPALTAAQDALSDALARLTEVGRARLAAEKRFKAEKTAENGRVLVALRHRWGLAQLAVADSGEKLVEVYRGANGKDTNWTGSAWSAQLTRWRAEEDSAEDKAAARAVGMTDEDIAASLARRRALTEKDRPDGGMFDRMTSNLCTAMRASGELYAKLPDPLSRPASQSV